MRKLLLLLFLVTFYFSCSSSPVNENGGNFSGVIDHISGKAGNLGEKGRPVRAAIVDFIPAQKKEFPKNEFGIYIAEKLITSIKRDHPRIRLFERKRIGSVVREHSLSLTGLMDPKMAKRIGELVPIDYLITGTYTKFRRYIEVNGRGIDVVTGEILFTFSDKVKIDRELAGIFDFEITPFHRKGSGSVKGGKCERKWSEINESLTNLSTASRINNAAAKAVEMPFHGECGKIHFNVINRFKKYGIKQKSYNQFLIKTLGTIKGPHDDRRATFILSFFHSQGILNKEKWDAGLDVSLRNEKGYMESHLTFLFHSRGLTEKQLAVQKNRIDEYFERVKKGKAGLPVPLSFDDSYYEIMSGLLNYFQRKNYILAKYCFEKYYPELKKTRARQSYYNLIKIFKNEKNENEVRRVFYWICMNFNKANPDEMLGQDMYDFARFLYTENINKRKSGRERLLDELFGKYKTVCREKLARALPMTGNSQQKKWRTLFCIKANIYCPDLVPDFPALKKKLREKETGTVLKALEIAGEMKEAALPLEGEIVRLLRLAEKKRIGNSVQIKYSCLQILGNINTGNPEALKIVVRIAKKGGSRAEKIISQYYGKPIMPYLIQVLNNEGYYEQQQIVRILRKMGVRARSAVPALKRAMRRTKSPGLKEMIREALFVIED